MNTRPAKMFASLLLGLSLLPSTFAFSDGDHSAKSLESESNSSIMMPMQNQMHHMQKSMDKIHGSKDTEERKKLLAEHLDNMQGMMKMMHGMMGSEQMMRPGSMHLGMMESQNNMGNRMNMMENRMDTMQLMMDQMLQNLSESLN